MIRIIASVARNSAIGRRGDLAFHISADLRRFKALTTGHTVIMGRRTFESLPKGALPHRRNIVVTRNEAYTAPGIERAPSLREALRMADEDAFILGGGEIYRQAMEMARELFITEIDADCPDADTFFPEISPDEWRLTEADAPATDDRSGLPYRFVCYCRK